MTSDTIAGRQAQSPLNALIFGCAGITALVTVRQMTAQREYGDLMSQFQALAATDSLTGLHNRRNFFRLADRRLSARRGPDEPVAVVMIDVDHFKLINDTYGHRVGDEVLAAVSHALTDAVRTGDVVARFGGDEFVVVAPGSAGITVARRVLDGVAALPLGDRGLISVSAGVARFPADGASAEELMAAAQAALANARDRGRGSITAAPEEAAERASG